METPIYELSSQAAAVASEVGHEVSKNFQVQGVHGHGGSPNSWMVCFMEKIHENGPWMMKVGVPPFMGNLQMMS